MIDEKEAREAELRKQKERERIAMLSCIIILFNIYNNNNNIYKKNRIRIDYKKLNIIRFIIIIIIIIYTLPSS